MYCELACSGATVHIADQSSFVERIPRKAYSVSSAAAPVLAIVIDAAALALAGFAANYSYQFALSGRATPLDGSPTIGVLGATIFCLLGRSQGLYRLRSDHGAAISAARLARVFAVSVALLTALLFVLKIGSDYSRGGAIVFAIFGLALLLAGRRALAATLRLATERGVLRGRCVVALGEAGELERFSGADFAQFGAEDVSRIALADHDRDQGLSEPDRLRVKHAVETARRQQADGFALLFSWSRGRALAEALELLRASPLPVRLYPDHVVREILSREAERGRDPAMLVVLQRAPLSPVERSLKRAFDVAVAAGLLVCLSPLLAAAALLVKLDGPGPVIFRQRRGGFDRREFVILKFRTMSVLEDSGEISQACRDDPRVTRVGRVLRRTSIDELPQLWNVIRGDMSLVGPRPHALAHDEAYRTQIANYALRNHVKPGLTGAAQVAGLRGETNQVSDMAERVDRDIWYIDNWSLSLDLRLLAQTFVTLVRHQAY